MNDIEKVFYKSKHSSDKWQPYFEVYERHLHHFVGKKFNMVEVGVQKGGSLEMWSNYFGRQMHITGIDIDPECSKLTYDAPNIDVVIGDQGDPSFWDNFLSNNKIDVFVDDGGHFMEQQILTFQKVFPTIKLGGVYICEDTHTSYMPAYGGLRNDSFIRYATSLVDVLHCSWYGQKRPEWLEDLSGIHFYDSMVVFEKFGKREMKNVFASDHNE